MKKKNTDIVRSESTKHAHSYLPVLALTKNGFLQYSTKVFELCLDLVKLCLILELNSDVPFASKS